MRICAAGPHLNLLFVLFFFFFLPCCTVEEAGNKALSNLFCYLKAFYYEADKSVNVKFLLAEF